MVKKDKFKEYLKERGLTIKSLARASGIPFSTLYKHVSSGNLTLEEVDKVSKAARMTAQEVIDLFVW